MNYEDTEVGKLITQYKALINDWNTWIPPGGRMWYDRCTDPSDNGFLVQISNLLNQLHQIYKQFELSWTKATNIYQLSRRMIEDADQLETMISKDAFLSEVVSHVEADVIREHPEMKDLYNLSSFIMNQKAYLEHITSVFHDVAQPSLEAKVCGERLIFYNKLHNVIRTFVCVVEWVHVFNKVDSRLRKTVYRYLTNSVNMLGEYLIGWDLTNIQSKMSPDDEVKNVMTKIFGYDIESSALTDELISLMTTIIKKYKDYAVLLKDLKHMINRTPDFWTAKERLIIHDGSSDSPAKRT